MKRLVLWLISTLLLSGCMASLHGNGRAGVTEENWGSFKGKEIKLFTLVNDNGMTIRVTNYAAAITSVIVPDRNGVAGDVVIGFDSLRKYIGDWGMHGKTIGRYANRIGGARFSLNGDTYELTANNGPNSLHGGPEGFSNQVFEVDSTFTGDGSSGIALHYDSRDMEEGFPGNLTLNVIFVLSHENEVRITYLAVTDKPTVVNFTNHSYFNLTGNGDPVVNEILEIKAGRIAETAPGGLPTGGYLPVEGTVYDFRSGIKLGDRFRELPRRPFGFDNYFVFERSGNEPELVAKLSDTINGRILEAYTTEPGMQLFTMANAVCLEMQHFPDSPNRPEFPGVILNPGETYRQVTVYKFSVARP
jgi:aldose 1-epimerase